MAEFSLIIKGGMLDYSDPSTFGPHMAEWAKFGEHISAHGSIKGGAGLTFAGSVVSNKGTQPFAAHGQDTLTGYYHIETKDRATAEAIAAQAPNIPLGGTVEVRELLPPTNG